MDQQAIHRRAQHLQNNGVTQHSNPHSLLRNTRSVPSSTCSALATTAVPSQNKGGEGGGGGVGCVLPPRRKEQGTPCHHKTAKNPLGAEKSHPATERQPCTGVYTGIYTANSMMALRGTGGGGGGAIVCSTVGGPSPPGLRGPHPSSYLESDKNPLTAAQEVT